MQAVVLAGGLGTRLAPLTRHVPKALVPVGGRPFLWYPLRWAARCGVREVVLCIGHLGDQVRQWLGTGRRLGLAVAYSDDGGRPLGTGGALRRAEPLLDRRFLLLYGDTYWPADLGALYRDLATRGALAVMGLVACGTGCGVRPNAALLGGRVVRYDKEAPGPGLTHADAGVLALRRAALALLPREGPSSLERDLYPELARRGRLAGWTASVAFHDIGTPEGLRGFERFLAGSPRG
jgi:NDP-sugar pyrophosphorylase family protein